MTIRLINPQEARQFALDLKWFCDSNDDCSKCPFSNGEETQSTQNCLLFGFPECWPINSKARVIKDN